MHQPSFSQKSMRYLRLWLDAALIQISALCGTYGLLVIAYLVLYVTVGERWFVISLLNNFGHLITLFCVPALLIVLIVKQHRAPWAIYLLPGTMAFIVWYGVDFLPNMPNTDHPDAIELSVMTYNIAGSWSTLVAITGDELDVDIAGLQELPKRLDWWSFFYQENGKGIYSRYPIISPRTEMIFRADNSYWITGVKAEIDVDGQIISVYSFHAFRPELLLRPFRYTTQPRYDDVKGIVDAVATDPNPVIVMCDCNFSDRTDVYQLMTTQLHDSWKEKGIGLGLTTPSPAGKGWFPTLLLRSDYIWHTDDFEVLSIDVLSTELSDHYPVKAHLRLVNTDD